MSLATQTAYERELRANRLQNAAAIGGVSAERARFDRDKLLAADKSAGVYALPPAKPKRPQKPKPLPVGRPRLESDFAWNMAFERRLEELNVRPSVIAKMTGLNKRYICDCRQNRFNPTAERRDMIEAALAEVERNLAKAAE